MTDAPKPPQKYQYCNAHMRPSIGPNRCHECFGPVANPVNDEPVQKVNKPSEAISVNPSVSANVETPVLTDPTAQKVVEAAQNYARAIEAVAILTEQAKGARELLHALETKLKETRALAEAAQDELRNATIKIA